MILETLNTVKDMVGKINEASAEQTGGIEEVNQAMGRVNKHAAETASEADVMTGISASITDRVGEIRSTIEMLGQLLNHAGSPA